MSGLERNLKEVNEKLEHMMRRLDYLEAVLTESRQYPELAQVMGDLRVGAALYSEPLKLIQRLVSVRRHLSRDEEHRDDVSRVTVRKKVLELVEEGIVEKAEGHSYRLKE